MAIIKCKMCGGDLNIVEGSTVAECEYCGTRQTVPTADNEKKMTLFARANRLLRSCEFDKAAGIFESIAAEFPQEAEAHWGLVLCKYGIEYVDDPATGKKVPTCHRTSFDSVLEDDNFEQAQENADAVARRVYRDEAKAIEELRKGIIEVSGKEEPYDIFICYKETDDDGNRTLDSVLAQDVYDALTEKGYRVFFARISLEDKLGTEYEPYIFAALNSAKIMLAFGTDYEYYNAVWVKNEWSRFLALIAAGQKKVLIPCFKNLDPYDMPKEFAKLQAQDMGKVGAMQDLLRGIGKILPKNENTQPVQQVIQQIGGTNMVSLLKRGQMALEDGDWAKADGFFEDVLNQDAENARAYIGKALVKEKQPSLEKLAQAHLDRTQNADTEKLTLPEGEAHIADAIKLAVPIYYESDEIQKAYLGFDPCYSSQVKSRENQRRSEEVWWQQHRQLSRAASFARGKEKAELENARNRVLNEMTSRIAKAQAQENEAEADVKERYADFLKKTDAEVREKAAKAQEQRENYYEYYKAKAETEDSIVQLRSVIDSLKRISGYKDSDALIKQAQEKLDAIETEEARIRAEKEAEEAKFKAEAKKKAKRKATIIGSVSAIAIVAVIAVILVMTKVVIPGQKYKAAEALLAAGDYEGAIAAFEALGDYKDSAEQAEAAQLAKTELKMEAINSEAYKEAEGLLANGDTVHAAMAFGALGSYSDAKERSFSLWNEIALHESISAGNLHTVGLKSDGTVLAVGNNDAGHQCEVSGWSDIMAVSAGSIHTVGLKSDGTVVVTTSPDNPKVNYGQCDVTDWTNIVAVSAGGTHTIGLKADGTTVAVGSDSNGQTEVSNWEDIIAVSTGAFHTVELKSNGSVVAVGYNNDGECNLSTWGDIVAVSAGEYHTVGLRADGTVIAEGDNSYGQCDVSDWTDIVAVSAWYHQTVGLKSDGTVVAVGNNDYGQCDVSGWTDIVAVSAGRQHTVGLKADGTVVAVGDNSCGQCDVSGWTDIKLP